jgi:rubredoxin
MTPEDFKNCPGCEGGKKWPEDEPAWSCPVCALIYIEYDDDEESDIENQNKETCH